MGSDGNLKSTYQVLKEISEEWDNMTTAERQALGISLAGKTQFEVFTSVLNNFEGAEKALTLATESQNSAWKENARYMESIEAKYQALKTATENLILGDGGLEKLVKIILTVTTAIVNFIDKAGGLTTVIGALTSALILLNSKALMKMIMSFPLLWEQIKLTTTAYIEFATTASTANEILTASIPIVGIVIAVLTALFSALVLLYKQITVTVDEIQELGQKFSNEKGEIEDLTKQVDRLREKLKKLQEVESPTIIEQKEIDKTEYEIAQLERELALKEKIAQKDKEKLTKQVEKQVYGYGAFGGYGLGGVFDNSFDAELTKSSGELLVSASRLTGIDYQGKQGYQRVEAYRQIQEELSKLIVQYHEEQKTLDESSSKYKELEFKIQECQSAYDKIDEHLPSVVQKLDSLTEGLDENSVLYQIIKDTVNDYTDSLIENQEVQEKSSDIDEYIQQTLNDVADKYQLNAEQIEELNAIVKEAIENKSDEEDAYEVAQNAIDNYIDSIEGGIDAWERWNETLDTIQSAYETLSGAVEEYNETQAFTIDTVQSLLNLGSDYLSLLDFENGKLSLNKEAIMEKVKAQIEEAKATVYQEAVDRLEALAKDKVIEASKSSVAQISNETTALKENTSATLENSEAKLKNAINRAYAEGVTQEEVNKVVSDMNKQLKILDELTLNVGNSFESSMSKAKTSTQRAKEEVNKTKEAVNALKQEVEDLKDEISDYDKVIAYINGKLDDEIDRLEDLRDKEVEAIEKQIDELEALQKKEEEEAKARIKFLEQERDALIDNNKLQINYLQERQNAEEEYWNNKIQALKDQNNALQDQVSLEQLLANLEKAKNTKIRVYKQGQGFVWDTDSEAVTKAQQQLDEYNRKKAYEQQLNELENYKKNALKNYEDQINDLKTLNDNIKNQYDKQITIINNHIDAQKTKYNAQIQALNDLIAKIKANYQVQIDYFNNYKTEFNKQVKAYETEQNRLLALQKTGIDFENENWKTRLNNLNKFTTEYNNKLAELSNKQKQLAELERQLNSSSSSSYSSSSSGGSGAGSVGTTGASVSSVRTKTVYVVNGREYQSYNEAVSARDASNSSIQSQINNLTAQKNRVKTGNTTADEAQKRGIQSQIDSLERQKVGISSKTVAYASGVASIGSNQFAIVGDSPNKELVIGSKLNGLGLNLAKGTGVVNAKSTGTLAGLFNMLGGELSKGINGNYSLSNNNTQSSNNIHIDNISLPQVRDADDFINAMSNFQNIMAQKSYAII